MRRQNQRESESIRINVHQRANEKILNFTPVPRESESITSSEHTQAPFRQKTKALISASFLSDSSEEKGKGCVGLWQTLAILGGSCLHTIKIQFQLSAAVQCAALQTNLRIRTALKLPSKHQGFRKLSFCNALLFCTSFDSDWFFFLCGAIRVHDAGVDSRLSVAFSEQSCSDSYTEMLDQFLFAKSFVLCRKLQPHPGNVHPGDTDLGSHTTVIVGPKRAYKKQDMKTQCHPSTSNDSTIQLWIQHTDGDKYFLCRRTHQHIWSFSAVLPASRALFCGWHLNA